MHYAQYLVSDSDVFNADKFPKVVTEMDAIRSMIETASIVFDTDMLVSFLKDHSMENAKVNNNNQLADMISSRALAIGNTEALFMSCSNNEIFRKQLEEYVRERCKA